MRQDFVVFGPLHLAILAGIPVLAALLAYAARRCARLNYAIRLSLAAVLMGSELLYYGYMAGMGVLRYPDGLPLQFCNIVLWLTVFTLVTQLRGLTEVVWYLGVFGPTVGLLVPQLWLPALSLPSIQYFLGHAGVVVSVLYLVLSGEARPSARSAWIAFAVLNAAAAGLGAFDAVHATNYMFLRERPAAPKAMLDLFGPWPWYLARAELVSAACFGLLALPFSKGARRRASAGIARALPHRHSGAAAAAHGITQSGD